MNVPYLDVTRTTAAAVDELGRLQARRADIDTQIEIVKNAIKALGDGSYEGDLFRATVSTTDRETLDMKAVRAHLSRQFIAAHTNVTSVVTLKVVARTGKGA